MPRYSDRSILFSYNREPFIVVPVRDQDSRSFGEVDKGTSYMRARWKVLGLAYMKLGTSTVG